MRRGERGSSLLVALLILLLAFLVLMAVTARAAASARAVRDAQSDARALNAAEAGLATAVQRLARDRSPETEGPVAMGRATWSVESRTLGGHGPWRRVELIARGVDGGRDLSLRAVVEVRLPPPGVAQDVGRVRLRSWDRLPRGSE